MLTHIVVPNPKLVSCWQWHAKTNDARVTHNINSYVHVPLTRTIWVQCSFKHFPPLLDEQAFQHKIDVEQRRLCKDFVVDPYLLA